MKDFENTIDLIICECEHWLKMCDIAENDYDIGYFGARAIVDENIIKKYKKREVCSMEELSTYLLSKYKEEQGYKKEYIDENNCESEKIQGFIDEHFFLLNLINQGPFKTE